LCERLSPKIAEEFPDAARSIVPGELEHDDLEESPHSRAVVLGELRERELRGESWRSVMHKSQRPSSSSSGTVSERQRQHLDSVSSPIVSRTWTPQPYIASSRSMYRPIAVQS
jgi:hypothetical protein